jgi:hypothetical protein
VDLAAKELGGTRGALIRKRCADKRRLGCPARPLLALEWTGAPEMPSVEAWRNELRPQCEGHSEVADCV